jgi:hypothetical protein
MTLDAWTITDVDGKWDFRVVVEPDNNTEHPRDHADVYDPDFMERENGPESAQWARDALAAYDRGEWQWVTLAVTPELKSSGVTFDGATASVGACDWGWLPGGPDDKGVWTSNRDYAREAWLNDLIDESRGILEDKLPKVRDAL